MKFVLVMLYVFNGQVQSDIVDHDLTFEDCQAATQSTANLVCEIQHDA
jgi:hypothetical protein